MPRPGQRSSVTHRSAAQLAAREGRSRAACGGSCWGTSIRPRAGGRCWLDRKSVVDEAQGGLRSAVVVNSALVSDLTERLAGVAAQFEASRLGLYLHGSHARGEAGRSSDIDVLGLSSTDEGTRLSAQEACREALGIAGLGGDRLDLKIIDSERFAADPWVDLRRARWLAGFAWHEELPARTQDQAARESLLVLAVLFEDDVFAQREPGRLRKPVGRLLSVLAGLVCATVPQSAAEARRLLGSDGQLTRELGELLDELGRLPDDVPIAHELSERVQQAAVDVAGVLRIHVERGELGPICTEAGEQALAAFADRCKRSSQSTTRSTFLSYIP